MEATGLRDGALGAATLAMWAHSTEAVQRYVAVVAVVAFGDFFITLRHGGGADDVGPYLHLAGVAAILLLWLLLLLKNRATREARDNQHQKDA